MPIFEAVRDNRCPVCVDGVIISGGTKVTGAVGSGIVGRLACRIRDVLAAPPCSRHVVMTVWRSVPPKLLHQTRVPATRSNVDIGVHHFAKMVVGGTMGCFDGSNVVRFHDFAEFINVPAAPLQNFLVLVSCNPPCWMVVHDDG